MTTYCGNCKHVQVEGANGTIHTCIHPHEIRPVGESSYFAPAVAYRSETECSKKNAGNDCTDFEVCADDLRLVSLPGWAWVVYGIGGASIHSTLRSAALEMKRRGAE